MTRPGQSIGPYRVLGLLGRGGMGSVYEVEDAALGRRLALKLLPRGRAEGKAAERFLREARALAQVRHPNVVAVHDTGEDPAGLYFVMDLVPGQDVLSLAQGRPRPPREAAEVVLGVCDALSALHAAGLLHRDVKPENVVLRADRGTPVLLDLGLALEASAERLTRTGQLVGTPYAMSPEQVGGQRDLTPASDVYGAGIVLYVLLTGEAPFDPEGCELLELLSRVCRDEPRWPATDRDLLAILRQTLAKEPAERYPSAAALAEDLGRYLAGQPVRAQAPPPRGRRGLALAVGAALLTLGVGLILAGGPGGEPRAARSPSPSPPASSPPPLASPALDPLRALARLRAASGDEGRRLAAEWLQAFPDHAQARAVRALYLQRGLREPRASTPFPNALFTRLVALGEQLYTSNAQGLWSWGEGGPRRVVQLPIHRTLALQDRVALAPLEVRAVSHTTLSLFDPTPPAAVLGARLRGRQIAGMLAIDELLWVTTWDGNVAAYALADLRRGGEVAPRHDLGQVFRSPPLELAYHPRARLLLIGSGDMVREREGAPDCRLIGWSVAGEAPRRVFERVLPGSCGPIAVDGAQDRIAVGVLWVQEILLFDGEGAQHGQLVAPGLESSSAGILLGSGVGPAHGTQIRGLKFLPDGTLLSVAGREFGQEGELRAWDVSQRQELASRLNEPGVLYDLLVTPAGRVYTSRWLGQSEPGLLEEWDLFPR